MHSQGSVNAGHQLTVTSHFLNYCKPVWCRYSWQTHPTVLGDAPNVEVFNNYQIHMYPYGPAKEEICTMTMSEICTLKYNQICYIKIQSNMLQHVWF